MNDALLMEKVVLTKFGIEKRFCSTLTGGVDSQTVISELDDMYRDAVRISHEYGQPTFTFVFYAGHAITTSDSYELCGVD